MIYKIPFLKSNPKYVMSEKVSRLIGRIGVSSIIVGTFVGLVASAALMKRYPGFLDEFPPGSGWLIVFFAGTLLAMVFFFLTVVSIFFGLENFYFYKKRLNAFVLVLEAKDFKMF